MLAQALLLTVGGALLGLGLNAASPRPAALSEPVLPTAEMGSGGQCSVPGAPGETPAPRIDVQAAKGLCEACNAGFVDARSSTEYAEGHIANAVHLPPAGCPCEARAIDPLRAYRTVVVYDGDYSCKLADEVAARLRRAGLQDVRVLEGAWPAWVAAGGPGSSGACTACAEHAAPGASLQTPAGVSR